MKRLYVCLFVALSVSDGGSAFSQDRALAITIDDLPLAPGNRPTSLQAREVNAKIIAVLQQFRVPVIGFVNERKLRAPGTEFDSAQPDKARVALLESWLEAGLQLGNHGFRHLDLHRVAADVWENDILLGEQLLRPLLSRYGKKPEFFRHPYLHTGRSVALRDRTTAFLARHGYRVAPVTIDNQEWVFGFAYFEQRDPERRRRIGLAYVDYMKAMVRFYEDQTLAIIGEPIPHVLLIHVYALNADWLHEILTWLRARAYRFIPLEEALEHPAYQRADRYDGPSGISWLHRWAITDKMPASTFAGEPELPDWIQERVP